MPVETLRSGDSARSWLSGPIRPARSAWSSSPIGSARTARLAILARSLAGSGSAIRSPGASGITPVVRAARPGSVGFHSRARLQPVLPIDNDLIPFRDTATD